MIDPGHGGKDGGAGAGGLREADIALDISLRLAALLKADGHKPMLTRRTDETVSVEERWKKANKYRCGLFISLHANAGGGTGVEVAIPTATPLGSLHSGRDLAQNRRLAETIAASIAGRFGLKLRRDKGVMQETETRHGSLGVLRNTTMPAVLVEAGFLDAPDGSPDIDILRNRRQEMAQAIADGLERFLAPPKTEALLWPVPGFPRVSSGYRTAERPDHKGVDIARNLSPPKDILGAAIVAAADGTVTESRFGTGTGNIVAIDHGNGLATRYMHNEKNLVAKGQAVRRGDAIAAAGDTGDTSAPHLHFEVIFEGGHADPLLYVTPPAQQAPPAPDDAPALFRVRTGPFGTQEEAEKERDAIRSAGYSDAFVVRDGDQWHVQAAALGSAESADIFVKTLRGKGFRQAFVTW